MKTDLHPFHFRDSLPFGGDVDASLTAREIMDWIERFGVFERFVLGSHPPTFFQIRTDLPPEEYLDGVKSYGEQVRRFFSGRIFRGIECDLRIEAGGKFSFTPGEKLLSRFDPEVALVALHFHSSLTYAGMLELEITDLEKSLEWAIGLGRFAILAHPFDPLERIWREDPAGFERLANQAREKKVAFEINADKGFVPAILAKLVANGNLFSFGGDLHSLSHWLKRDDGLEVSPADERLVKRLLGLAREATDFEKEFWKRLDHLIWYLPYASVKRWKLRGQAVKLYRSCLDAKIFEGELPTLVEAFDPADKVWIVKGFRRLNRIYRRWGGEVGLEERYRAEKYFLTAPLTKKEQRVFTRYLGLARGLGLREDKLINNWETPQLEHFLSR